MGAHGSTYQADFEMDPSTDSYQQLLAAAAPLGTKVVSLGTTGPNGFPMYRIVGGSRGELQSMLINIGLNPNNFTITQVA